VTELVRRLRAGDHRALARAISLIEDRPEAAAQLVRDLYREAGRARVIGVTGPPGAGKSTLADRLTASYRAVSRTVGILATDPSSPFTGGALLGDRVRMQDHAGDTGVFIRSMATRGHLGGLARASADAVLVMDATGWDVIILETVGVGQDEVEVVRAADVSLVTLVPGSGDDVQALKAGIMEIADIFVVNKADREGADRLVATIESVLGLAPETADAWRPPVLQTVATEGTGIDTVIASIDRFMERPAARRVARARERAEARVREILDDRFRRRIDEHVLEPGEMAQLVDAVVSRDLDPYTAADRILSRVIEEGA
jgi:LAO/AO transport system kinase